MGKAEREKGKRFERDVANWLKKNGFEKAMRSAQHSGKAGDAADVVGLPGVHLECKAVETQNIWSWLDQAVRDSSGTGNIPVVIWKKNREPWMAILLRRDFNTMMARADDWLSCIVSHTGKNASLHRWLVGAGEYGLNYHIPVVAFNPEGEHPPIAALWADDFMELYKEGYHGDL